MRQRRIRDLDSRLEKVAHLNVENPSDYRGKWKEVFKEKNDNNGDIYLEIGCGKGSFICEMAEKNREKNFIAIEAQPSVILMAMEKVQKQNLDNVIFINTHLKDIQDIFEEDELAGLFLNFSDPWHKKRHGKRRLTHRRFLRKYQNVIRKDGFIQFKTDNDMLYQFTVEEVRDENMNIMEMSRDLHVSPYIENNVMTEYENKFVGRGKNINYIKIGV